MKNTEVKLLTSGSVAADRLEVQASLPLLIKANENNS